MTITEAAITDHGITDHPIVCPPRTKGTSTTTQSASEQRRVARDEIMRAAEKEFLAAVGRALDGEETATHRVCAVQWAEILAGLRATRT